MPSHDQPAILPRLRPVFALALVLLLVTAVFFLSLPDDKLWQRVLEDAGHGPVFAGIAVVLLLLRSPDPASALRPMVQYRDAFLAAIIIGIATELMQLSMPVRNVSAMDVLHDAAGAALGLALVWLLERHLLRRRGVPAPDSRTRVPVAIALAAFVILAWQPLQSARAYAARAAAGPALLPLEGPAAGAFIQLHDTTLGRAPLPAGYGRRGEADSVRLRFDAGAQPGLRLIEPVADWTRYEQLVIDVTNPAPQPVQLVLRIFDATHDWTHRDRFNQPLLIPGRTRTAVRISLEAVATSPRRRRMDMAAIADVMLFAPQPLEAGELYVTRLWLE